MTPELWDRIMRQARMQAALYQERSRVRAALLPPRAAHHIGTPRVYVVKCPSICPCREE